jgi:hypothetical protein
MKIPLFKFMGYLKVFCRSFTIPDRIKKTGQPFRSKTPD